MMLVSDVHVLSAAYLMGLTAAAPMGPVNLLFQNTRHVHLGQLALALKAIRFLRAAGGQYFLSSRAPFTGKVCTFAR
jgi:hypothetical protein